MSGSLEINLVHENPVSTIQLVHPSLGRVLLSSQDSGAAINPFPQNEVQDEGMPEQLYPGLTNPAFEHPSVSKVFPSSHYSSPTINPSPCFGVQISIV